jgi:hypothetical protein
MWKNVGLLLKEKMGQKRGVSIEKLGMFTFSTNFEPVFVLDPSFAAEFRVQQRKVQPLNTNITVNRINMSQLSHMSNMTREVAKKVLTEIVASLGTAVRKRGDVRIAFNPVAELAVSKGNVTSNFSAAMRKGVRTQERCVESQSLPRRGGTGSQQPKLKKISQVLGSFGREMSQATRAGGNGPPTGEAKRRGDRARERGYRENRGSHANGAWSPGSSRGGGGPPSVRSAWGDDGDDANSMVGSQFSNEEDSFYDGEEAQDSSDRQLAAELLERIKARLIERGGMHGIHSLARVMAVMDDSGNKKLSR